MIRTDVIRTILEKCRTASGDNSARLRILRRSPAAGGGFSGPAPVTGTVPRPPRDPQTGSRLPGSHPGRRPGRRDR